MAHSAISIDRIISKLDEYLGKNDTDGARRHLLYWLDEAISEQNARAELLLRNELMGLYRKGGQRELAIENANVAMRKIAEMGVEEQVGSATTYLNCATVYKAFGMAYIRFAKEESELFKLLYMRNRSGEPPVIHSKTNDKMENLVDKALKEMISNALLELEDIANSDVLCYSGPIVDGNENVFLDIIEELADSPDKRDSLMVVLTTTGGSAMAVERYVNIIRKHYEKVSFVVPDYAYSAGTIFCMSGDEIWMDYFSVLGPIDPQVKNKEGKFVPALGYLDKVNSLIDKARNGSLTNAEFLILNDLTIYRTSVYA